MKKALRHYLIGILIVGFFPFFIHGCSTHDGDEQSRSFSASVERVGQTSQLNLAWEGHDTGTIDIYWSTSPRASVDGELLLITGATGGSIIFDDPSPTARPYFKLRTSSGLVKVVAERKLPVANVVNFRDIGGYRTADGKTVKWGVVFRSAALELTADYSLTEAGKMYMINSGIKTIVDWRPATDTADPLIDGIENMRLTVQAALISGPDLVSLNKNIIIYDNETYGQWFDLLLDPAKRPLLNRCTMGKDRTGWGSAIILLALGVPRNVVLEDYLIIVMALHPVLYVRTGCLL